MSNNMSNVITNNAYHILGLDGTANQKDILKRYKKIINRLKINDYPEYPLDINSPKKFRTEKSVNDALKRLENMKNNLFEYFFWFNIADTIDEIAFEHLQNNDHTSYHEAIKIWKNASNIENPTALHYKKNLALLYCLILVNDENDIHLRESLSNWKEIIDSDKFWSAFGKSYAVNNNQRISLEKILDFRNNIVKHISNIYHDLYLEHGNEKYIKDFQDVFGIDGDKTKENPFEPIYQSIYSTIEKLKKTILEKNDDTDKDETVETNITCDNCGTSEYLFDKKYEDDSILCIPCDAAIGKKWKEKIMAEKTVKGSSKIALKIERSMIKLESQFEELREIGLYNNMQSRVVRDHVVDIMMKIGVRIFTESRMNGKSMEIVNWCKKILYAESVKEKLQLDLKNIEHYIEKEKRFTIMIEMGELSQKTKLVIKINSIEYNRKKIYYKDVMSVAYNTHDNLSIILVSSSGDKLKIKFDNLEKLERVIRLIQPIIEPIIIDIFLELIFEIDASISMGLVKFDKDGFYGLGQTDNLRLRHMATPSSEFKFISWGADIYPAEISKGIVVLFYNKNNQREELTVVSLETPNASIIPALLKSCIREYHLRK